MNINISFLSKSEAKFVISIVALGKSLFVTTLELVDFWQSTYSKGPFTRAQVGCQPGAAHSSR